MTTHNLMFGVLIVRLVSECVEDVITSVHCVTQHLQLLEHGMICDVPSHGLVHDDLCPEQELCELVVHIKHLWLGAFADDEIDASSGHLTKDCRQ
nr:unnamed protein product [Digitaria exilis]